MWIRTTFFVSVLHDILFIALVYMCYLIFSSKAEARRPMFEQVVVVRAEVPPLAPVLLANEGQWGAKGLRRTSMEQASHSAVVKGHHQRSAMAVADRVFVNVEAGACDEVPLLIRQSFKDGWYSPLTGMEEVEWQIMLEQFMVSVVVVKDEIIYIDSD
jgi:hypothetical protein